jgi:hypothetical protein
MFFGKGRKPFLDFLRNLTPQIILLAISLIFANKLKLDKFDISLEGVKRTWSFVLFFLVFLAAALASFSTFLDESLEAYKTDNRFEMNDSKDFTRVKKLRLMISTVWAQHKMAVFNMILVMVVAISALSTVFMMGIQSAYLSPFLQK